MRAFQAESPAYGKVRKRKYEAAHHIQAQGSVAGAGIGQE